VAGPGAPAGHHKDRAAGCQTLLEETLKNAAQPVTLEPQIGHSLQHRAVLGRVMHVVNIDLRIAPRN